MLHNVMCTTVHDVRFTMCIGRNPMEYRCWLSLSANHISCTKISLKCVATDLPNTLWYFLCHAGNMKMVSGMHRWHDCHRIVHLQIHDRCWFQTRHIVQLKTIASNFARSTDIYVHYRPILKNASWVKMGAQCYAATSIPVECNCTNLMYTLMRTLRWSYVDRLQLTTDIASRNVSWLIQLALIFPCNKQKSTFDKSFLFQQKQKAYLQCPSGHRSRSEPTSGSAWWQYFMPSLQSFNSSSYP